MVPRRWAAYHLDATMLRRLRIENLVLIKEAELTFAPGLNAITGETGAGKTILAQAIGLLLGAKGDAGYIGADGTEAYVDAELDLPAALLEEDELAALAELRPEDEEGLVVARRVFADARVRLGAWCRTRGPRCRRRAVDRHVRPVRATSSRASRLPARRPRFVRRGRPAAAASRVTSRLARAHRSAAPTRRASAGCRGRRRAARRAARARRRHCRARARRGRESSRRARTSSSCHRARGRGRRSGRGARSGRRRGRGRARRKRRAGTRTARTPCAGACASR